MGYQCRSPNQTRECRSREGGGQILERRDDVVGPKQLLGCYTRSQDQMTVAWLQSAPRDAQGRAAMPYRSSIGAAALAAMLCISVAGAMAQDTKKYPDWEGLWKRGSPVGVWDPSKPPGAR